MANDILEALVVSLMGLLPAVIARHKGRSFVVWWIFGTLLFVVALPWSLLLKPDVPALRTQAIAWGMKLCPDCAEMVQGDARICRYCGYRFNAAAQIVRETGNSSVEADEGGRGGD